MTDFEYVLFDLDGTITDSSQGILRCIEYALQAGGRPVPERQVLLQFIGPPLVIGFQEILGMTIGRDTRRPDYLRQELILELTGFWHCYSSRVKRFLWRLPNRRKWPYGS